MPDMYFAEDERLTVYTDAGPVTRHNDMGDALRPYPARRSEDDREELSDANPV